MRVLKVILLRTDIFIISYETLFSKSIKNEYLSYKISIETEIWLVIIILNCNIPLLNQNRLI